MAMQLDIDFVAYMWVIGILMVVFAVVGYFVVLAPFLEHTRRREGTREREPAAHDSFRDARLN